MRMAGLLDVLRKGSRGVQADRDAARELTERWPRAPRAIRFYDLFSAWAALEATSAGATAVVFGTAGYPAGRPAHETAAAAGRGTRYFYAGSTVIAQVRALSLGGDPRASAVAASMRNPRALLAAVRAAGAGDGPYQVQMGFAPGFMTGAESSACVAGYAERLPRGSQLVIPVPDGDGGRKLLELAGAVAYSPADVAGWCGRAGLELSGGRLLDVRAWGREKLAEDRLPEDGNRIMAAVAVRR